MCVCCRSDRGRVSPPAGKLWNHRRAGDQASGQSVRRTKKSCCFCSDDDAMVTEYSVISCLYGNYDVIVMSPCLSCSPNFYILDEPTNHLDMETIEALAKALNKFKVSDCVNVVMFFLGVSSDLSRHVFQGGVVLVSHDERLIRMVCKELWVCENGKVGRIDGGFDEYRDILHEQFRKEGYL